MTPFESELDTSLSGCAFRELCPERSAFLPVLVLVQDKKDANTVQALGGLQLSAADAIENIPGGALTTTFSTRGQQTVSACRFSAALA